MSKVYLQLRTFCIFIAGGYINACQTLKHTPDWAWCQAQAPSNFVADSGLRCIACLKFQQNCWVETQVPAINAAAIFFVKIWMSNYQELLARKRELDKNIEQVRRKESETALATIKELIATFGFTAQQVFPFQSDSVKKKVPAKYYDPATGKSWTGRGKVPAWLDGKDRSLYEIAAPKVTQWSAPEDENNLFPIQ